MRINLPEDISLTASQLIEYNFCPRFTYFEYVLGVPQREGNRFKVEKGRQIHEITKKRNPGYLRKKLGTIKTKSDVYLSSKMGIRGIVDEILFFEDGTAAPLDYKFAEYKKTVHKTHRFQLIFYGKLIIDNYNVPVEKGFIVYTRSSNSLMEIKIGAKDYMELENKIRDVISIIQKGRYPSCTKYKKSCLDCCYRNICEQTI